MPIGYNNAVFFNSNAKYQEEHSAGKISLKKTINKLNLLEYNKIKLLSNIFLQGHKEKNVLIK